MIRILIASLAVLVGVTSADAQNANQGRVVASCGTPGITYTVGGFGAFTVDENGNLCGNQSGGGSSTANQGTANTLANAWPVQITDTTNGPAAVKAASTAPATTDPALVVAVSPNSTVTPAGFSYKNITTDATTTVKSAAGVLHTITFNAPTATETVTIYDNTAGSGTKIGTITIPASPMPITLTYDVSFTTGLTIVTATATSDITVSYR